MEVISKNALHGGMNLVVRHDSVVTSCPMELSIYIPPGKGPFPCLYYLSGLTCTWENAATKAGAQAYAAKAGIVLVFPDTSPRGDDIADDDAFSLGKGAGYYMDATEQPWAKHYQMDSYITKELPKIVSAHASIDHDRCGITGHSMGGHGALMLAMKNPGQYRSVSAFAPIASLTSAPWGKVAIDAYRGGSNAELYDVCKLMASHGWSGQILVDQGEADNFKDEHLMPDKLIAAAAKNNIDLTLRLQEGYDHSYWFVASFIEDHINWHAARLR
ncbi:MAG: S-formylglutathione hydrolase [Candidatus Puniceispirillales bacterium WSBS_2018_MAG_OTU23]